MTNRNAAAAASHTHMWLAFIYPQHVIKKAFVHPLHSLSLSTVPKSPQMLTYNEKYVPNAQLDSIYKDMAAAEAEAATEAAAPVKAWGVGVILVHFN